VQFSQINFVIGSAKMAVTILGHPVISKCSFLCIYVHVLFGLETEICNQDYVAVISDPLAKPKRSSGAIKEGSKKHLP
jgi:hypothetical protein